MRQPPSDVWGWAALSSLACATIAPYTRSAKSGSSFCKSAKLRNTRCSVALEFEDGGGTDAITYVALADNPSFVGAAPLAAMVKQIAHSHGPSGSNREYLARLADHLAQLNIHDEEVHGLHQAVQAHDIVGAR